MFLFSCIGLTVCPFQIVYLYNILGISRGPEVLDTMFSRPPLADFFPICKPDPSHWYYTALNRLLIGTAPRYLSDQLQYIRRWSTVETPRPAALVDFQSPRRPRSARRDLLLLAIARLLLPARDFGTVYLSTSSLPRHSQHFVTNWKLIYFGNHIQTLFFNCFAIVVLEVSFT